MSFAIVVDSTCDMTLDELDALGVELVPLTITVDGANYLDQLEISSLEFYERMSQANELPKTAQPAPYDFKQAYEKAYAAGCEGVLSLHIAHVLSGTVESARLAARMVDFPVEVVDCAGATAQFALLVQEASRLRASGLKLQETCTALHERIPQTSFFIGCETLEHLLKGGRLQPQEAEQAAKLNIKPVLTFDEAGVLRAFDKVRGMGGVRKLFVEQLQAATEQRGTQRVRIAHANNPEEAAKLREAIAESGLPFEDSGTCICGATVGTHLGAGALGMALIPA